MVDPLQQEPASSLIEIRISGGDVLHSGGEDIALNLDSSSSENKLFNISRTLYKGLGVDERSSPHSGLGLMPS